MNGIVPALADTSLRSRRRMVEACALAARSIGLISTLAVAQGWLPQGGIAFSPALITSCYVAVVVMAVANVLAVAGLRRPLSRHYPAWSFSQILLDTGLIIGMVVLFALYGERTTWPLLAVPIVIAAVRLRLPGALIVWALTSASYAGVIWYLGERAVRPEDVPFAVSIHLLVALVAGTQATAFHRQLADLQQTRAALQHQVSHDGLTGLPNRGRLTEYFRTLGEEPVVLLLLDLDGFKPVNDTHGHTVGDEVLRAVAGRLGALLRPQDMAGRLGGDEFLVVMPGADEAAARAVVGRIRETIGAPIAVGERTVRVGTSVGTALRPAGGRDDMEALTVQADAAMYRDKDRRRGRLPA